MGVVTTPTRTHLARSRREPSPVKMSVSDESLTEVDSISKEGWLWKTGSNNKGWRERYFVLANGKLSYYKSDKPDAAVQGSVDLVECDRISQSAGKKGFGFDIFVPGRVYNISADTQQVQQEWMTAINTSLAIIKSLPVDSSRSRVTSTASIRSSTGGLLKRRSAHRDSTNSADRKEDTVHSLLEAEVDALHSKMANMEDSLQSSQSNYSQLQEELRLCKQQHSLEINVIKDEVETLNNEVKSLQQAKYQLEMMNDSYKEQLHERDDEIEGLREELRALDEESSNTQHMLEEAHLKTNELYTQTLQDGETVSSLQGELDAMREQSLRLEEKIEKLNQQLADVAMETTTASNTELLSVRSQLDEAQRENTQLKVEMETLRERTRQLQLEKDKAMSDLIALKKSQKNRERILSSEGEEGKLAPHRVDKTRHSPAPERTVSEHVLAEAEKRAELATRLLQEVQAERDSLKAQLGKHSPSSPRQPNGDNRSSDNMRLSPARLLSKSPPTTAVSGPADVPPKKPQRPPDNLLGMYRSEFI